MSKKSRNLYNGAMDLTTRRLLTPIAATTIAGLAVVVYNVYLAAECERFLKAGWLPENWTCKTVQSYSRDDLLAITISGIALCSIGLSIIDVRDRLLRNELLLAIEPAFPLFDLDTLPAAWLFNSWV
jgi:hypothetical protein